MLGVFAEFERAIIQKRVRAGIARARTGGKHLGRPYINGETEQAIRAALAAGKGIRKAAAGLWNCSAEQFAHLARSIEAEVAVERDPTSGRDS